MIDQRFPRALRLRGHDAFGVVIRQGAVAANDFVVAYALRRDREINRFGITIPKKVGNAVVRNRWKRAIREAIRHCQHDVPSAFDFVIRPKKGAVLHSKALASAMRSLFRRAAQRAESQSNRQPGS